MKVADDKDKTDYELLLPDTDKIVMFPMSIPYNS
jgi:hypothetical protein